MPILASSKGGGSFHTVAPGTYQAVCYDVYDLGYQRGEYQGKENVLPKIMVAWELEERIVSEDDMNGQRYRIYKRYTLSLGNRATLTKDLASWRGKPFTKEEEAGFDVEKLIGANCLLNIVHNESGGKTYANIMAVSPLAKGMQKINPENKRGLPDWVAKIQAKAVHNEAAVHQESAPAPTDEDEGIPF